MPLILLTSLQFWPGYIPKFRRPQEKQKAPSVVMEDARWICSSSSEISDSSEPIPRPENGGVCTFRSLGQRPGAYEGGAGEGEWSSALGRTIVVEFEFGGSVAALRGGRESSGFAYLLGEQRPNHLEVSGEGVGDEDRSSVARSSPALYQVSLLGCFCFFFFFFVFFLWDSVIMGALGGSFLGGSGSTDSKWSQCLIWFALVSAFVIW